jgi:hypothetical protein
MQPDSRPLKNANGQANPPCREKKNADDDQPIEHDH